LETLETLEIERAAGRDDLDESSGGLQRLRRAAHRRTPRRLRALDADAGVRVVVLAGRGRHFSAGADLNWMRRAAGFGEAENLADARRFAGMLRALAGMGKPTIARVQGAALGGGTGLTAACDMAIAADDAQFSTSEVKFGIIPAVISPFVLRAVGPRHALRIFQSAERIDAARPGDGPGGRGGAGSRTRRRHRPSYGTAGQLRPDAQKAAKDLIAAVDGRPIDDAVSEKPPSASPAAAPPTRPATASPPFSTNARLPGSPERLQTKPRGDDPCIPSRSA
jgi:methylglutaconyl-CoA hydratase